MMRMTLKYPSPAPKVPSLPQGERDFYPISYTCCMKKKEKSLKLRIPPPLWERVDFRVAKGRVRGNLRLISVPTGEL